jgi:hypothetical protein
MVLSHHVPCSAPSPLAGEGLGRGVAPDSVFPGAPPSLSLPRKGGGDVVARAFAH